jgi:hypothetical protein
MDWEGFEGLEEGVYVKCENFKIEVYLVGWSGSQPSGNCYHLKPEVFGFPFRETLNPCPPAEIIHVRVPLVFHCIPYVITTQRMSVSSLHDSVSYSRAGQSPRESHRLIIPNEQFESLIFHFAGDEQNCFSSRGGCLPKRRSEEECICSQCEHCSAIGKYSS